MHRRGDHVQSTAQPMARTEGSPQGPMDNGKLRANLSAAAATASHLNFFFSSSLTPQVREASEFLKEIARTGTDSSVEQTLRAQVGCKCTRSGTTSRRLTIKHARQAAPGRHRRTLEPTLRLCTTAPCSRSARAPARSSLFGACRFSASLSSYRD